MILHEDRHTHQISGKLRNRVLATLLHDNQDISDKYGQGDLQVLFGQVLVDYKGRFDRGSWLHSSVVKEVDQNKSTVKTMNSLYYLDGDGYEITADLKFYALFKCSTLRPLEICEANPEIIYSRKILKSKHNETSAEEAEIS